MSEEQESSQSEKISIPETEALRLTHGDAKSAIERGLNKHGDHASKSIKMVQINGIVISILVAGASQMKFSTYVYILTGLGAVFLFLSSFFALRAYTSQSLSIGISSEDIDRINRNNLSENQYLIWYLTEYYPDAIGEIKRKIEKRADNVEYSIYAFFVGLLSIASGVIMQFAT